MIALTLRQLAIQLSGQLVGADAPELAEKMVHDVAIDTRKLTSGCLFIALKGERFDAHDFAQQAIDGGAGALLVSKHLPFDIPQIIVADTRLALGQLGRWVREQVSARVVALTGSSGKTSVKEMTAAILAQCGNVLYTAGNLNNDIGVPLTLLRLTHEHQYAVIELGANHIGEIAYSVALAQPETALVNNLAAAHLEGFGSLAGVAEAKGEIFNQLPLKGTAIINLNSHDLSHWQSKLDGRRLWRFSHAQAADADFYATNITLTSTETLFTLHSPQGSVAIKLPLLGQHNIDNALAACALAMSVGASLEQVQQGLALSKPVAGRLFPIELSTGKLLIDDTYNANVGSMTAAAQVLGSMPGYRVMVVGDMGELGDESELCHQQVGHAARLAGIDRVLSVGRLSQSISQASGCGEHLVDKKAVIARLIELLSEHKVITILIKGSRSAAMEQVVHGLKENTQC